MKKDYNWYSTRYNTRHPNIANTSINGLLIEKPINLDNLKNIANIKALIIEKGSSFKKDEFNTLISKAISCCNLEFLEIRGKHNEVILPEKIFDFPLYHLSISCSNDIYLNHLDKLNKLEFLKIKTFGHLSINKNIESCLALKEIELISKTSEIESVYKLNNIEKLNLSIEDLKNINELSSKNLHTINLQVKNLSKIEPQVNLKALKELRINSNHITELPISLFSESLENAHLGIPNCNINFPDKLTCLSRLLLIGKTSSVIDAPLLKHLHLSISQAQNLDKILKNTPALETLYINNITQERLPNSLIPSIIELKIENINYDLSDFDISNLDTLKSLMINNGNNVKIKLPTFYKLEDISLTNIGNKNLSLIQNHRTLISKYKNDKINNESILNRINIKECKKLKTISISKEIKRIEISLCEKLKGIEFENRMLNLKYLSIYNCKNLKLLPAEILISNPSISVKYENTKYSIQPKQFQSLIKSFSSTFDKNTMFKISKYLFEEKNKHKHHTLKAFSIKDKETFTFLSQFIYKLNKEGKPFEKHTLTELKDKSIAITGKPYEKKTNIKEQIGRLGMKYSAKIENADFVILCYGADITNCINQSFIKETVFSEYCKKEVPKFLVASASKEHISKLREIMWSTDPNSENIALEMLKKGGLLNEVIGEAVCISKTSVDKSIKRKYKNFLKGKVNPDWQKVISTINVKTYWLPEAIRADYLRAIYKRTNELYQDFLRYNWKDLEIRRQIVIDYILKEAKDRPHYLNLLPLYNNELDLILNLPEIKGKLKRLIVSVIDTIPDSLSEHITLKQIELRLREYKKLPKQIYPLTRLSNITINCDELEYIEDDILNLKQLKTLYLRSDQKISLPSKILELPKFENKYISEKYELRN